MRESQVHEHLKSWESREGGGRKVFACARIRRAAEALARGKSGEVVGGEVHWKSCLQSGPF